MEIPELRKFKIKVLSSCLKKRDSFGTALGTPVSTTLSPRPQDGHKYDWTVWCLRV